MPGLLARVTCHPQGLQAGEPGPLQTPGREQVWGQQSGQEACWARSRSHQPGDRPRSQAGAHSGKAKPAPGMGMVFRGRSPRSRGSRRGASVHRDQRGRSCFRENPRKEMGCACAGWGMPVPQGHTRRSVCVAALRAVRGVVGGKEAARGSPGSHSRVSSPQPRHLHPRGQSLGVTRSPSFLSALLPGPS